MKNKLWKTNEVHKSRKLRGGTLLAFLAHSVSLEFVIVAVYKAK